MSSSSNNGTERAQVGKYSWKARELLGRSFSALNGKLAINNNQNDLLIEPILATFISIIIRYYCKRFPIDEDDDYSNDGSEVLP